MNEIADWLRQNGLAQLIDLFQRQDVDLEVLKRLTDQELKELGLTLGLRKKLLNAIARDPVFEALPDPGPAAPVEQSRSAERRQLTVMFCDLVDSTALSDRLDPEDLTFVLQSYKSCCAQFVERFGGTISKYLGDGILACFGYPTAHEDDAERAVHAALGIARAAPKLEALPTVALHTRIGIATGKVIVGDLTKDGVGEEGAIIGATTNLAARLQSVAAVDGVVIAPSTRKLIGGLFELLSLGALDLKGFSRPVQVWSVLGESSQESRFDAMHPTRAGPVIGRQKEIAALSARWEIAKQGKGQVVLISGEAGIGKSRIVSELRERLAHEPCFHLSYYGSQRHQTNALYPIITQIERNADIARDDNDETRLNKLEAFLASAAMSQSAPALATLLSIPTAARYPPASLTPLELKKQIFAAVIGRFESLSREKPVLLVIEDLHWIDPTSIELIEQLVERIKELPVLVVLTTRPQAEAPAWVGKDHVAQLSLDRLNREDSIDLVRQIVGGVALGEDILEQILTKADGVPLYHEELTKTVLESEAIAAEQDQTAALSVPTTLHDSLMARLDRMFSAKQIAQLAATIGRTFSRDLLRAACGAPDQIVDSAIAQLVDAGLVSREDSAPELTYQFKHALLQDVAYQSLLRHVRRQYHHDIAKALLDHFPQVAEVQPEVLAYHHTEAGDAKAAIAFWKRAGKRATERSANVEAITQYTAALKLLPELPDGQDKVREEYDILMGLIPSLIASKGYSSFELESAIARALKLADQLGGTPQIFPLLFSQYAYHLMTGQLRRAAELAHEFSEACKRPYAVDLAPIKDHIVASCQLFLGDPADARKGLADSVDAYEFEKDRQQAFAYGHDLLVTGLGKLALALWHLGLVDEAQTRHRQSVVHARALSHWNSLGASMFYGASLQALCRNGEGVKVFAGELSSLGAEHKLAIWSVNGTYYNGWALAEEGRLAEGCALMEEALEILRGMRLGHWRPIFLTWCASAYCELKDRDRARALLDEARAIMDFGGERWMESEFYIVKSKLELAVDGRGEDCARQAVEIATAQRSLSMQVRAAAHLAKLLRAAGRSGEARAALEGACKLIPPKQTSFDFSQARGLLAELPPALLPTREHAT